MCVHAFIHSYAYFHIFSSGNTRNTHPPRICRQLLHVASYAGAVKIPTTFPEYGVDAEEDEKKLRNANEDVLTRLSDDAKAVGRQEGG